MKSDQDAFGEEIFAFFQRLQMGDKNPQITEIVERDDRYIDVSKGPINYFAPFRDWSPHQQAAMAYVRGRVIDIGCGAGRVGLYLQSLGLDVVSIDNSPKAVKVCQLRGLNQVYLKSIKQVNSRLGRFDTIIMLGNNFGLFGSVPDAKKLLRRFHRLTNAGARLIAESNDIYTTTNPLHLEYHQLNRDRNRLPGQVRLRIRYQKTTSPWIDYLLVSPGEMEEIVNGTGWQVERFISSDAGPMYIGILARKNDD